MLLALSMVLSMPVFTSAAELTQEEMKTKIETLELEKAELEREVEELKIQVEILELENEALKVVTETEAETEKMKTETVGTV